MFAKRIFIFCVVIAMLLLPLNTVLAADSSASVVIIRVKSGGLATETCGSTWAEACSMSYVLGHTIKTGREFWVAAGTYLPSNFELKSGVAFYGGFIGTETSRSERDWKKNVTILSKRTIYAVDVDTTAVLDGFTISDATNLNGSGGGISLWGTASPTLTNLMIKNNHANDGGGLAIVDYGSPILTNVTFYRNTANGININRGGGMFSYGGNPQLIRVIFRENTAINCCSYSDGNGGGLYLTYGSPTLTNVVFTNNEAGVGGALYSQQSSYTINNASFSNNTAGVGGAIYQKQLAVSHLNNITINDNTATMSGGGIAMGGAYMYVTNATISGNTASTGGGVSADGGTTFFTNVTIANNSATSAGSAIYSRGGSLQVYNTIIANNGLKANSQIYSDSYFSAEYTLITGGCPSGEYCDHLITEDPRLGVLGNYGGFTQTIPLLSGSPAIDMGGNNMSNNMTCPSTDQRGIARPEALACDLGAYEGSIPSNTSIFNSIGEDDGWILESDENSNVGGSMNATNATIIMGDNTLKKQLLGILSFETSNLPDTAIVAGVTMKIKKYTSSGTGDPLAVFHGFMMDIKNGFFGSSSALEISDFQEIANTTFGPISPTPVNNWYSINLTNVKDHINKLPNNGGLTQIRLRFKLDDNNDAVANYLSLYSGNATATLRPQLLITYYMP